MQSRHLIAFRNIIRVSCNKDNLHRIILFANPFGKLHTVHRGHLNVQQ